MILVDALTVGFSRASHFSRGKTPRSGLRHVFKVRVEGGSAGLITGATNLLINQNEAGIDAVLTNYKNLLSIIQL